MDLPATQAIAEDEIACTQQVATNENIENAVIGTLTIGDKQHLIHSGITTIGRHPASTIIINHETVSKKHAEIESETINGSLFIKDLNSCNKTKINNSKLRSYYSYQIKDGDKLIFGQVVSTFKLHDTPDDSFVASTPQVKKKIQAFVPGTPDSSLNASSTSENNVSVIPETQTDTIDTSFQTPQVPVINNEKINLKFSPVINPDFLSSSLSPNKSDQNDITDLKTQILSLNDIKKESNNSINASEIKNSISGNKSNNDSDENIYEMETQRPFNLDENEDNIEDIVTQQMNYNKSDLDEQKFNDLTIYNTNTQKNNCEISVNDSIINLETPQFDCSSDFSNKTVNNSIYNAATQKITSDILSNESVKNPEMQQLNYDKNNSNKIDVQDMSIYSAQTQKIETKESVSDIENVEMRKLNCNTSDSAKEKLKNQYEQSIYTAETEIIEPTVIGSQKYINNLGREKLDNVEYNKTPKLNLSKTKSNYKSSDEISHTTVDKCIDIETRLSDSHESDNKLFYNDIVHENISSISINESVKNSDKINKISHKHKSENNFEDDKLKQNIESENLIKKNSKTISNLESPIENIEKVNLIKDKNSFNDNEDCNIQDLEELFDSGFRTTESDDPNTSNNIKSNDNKISELQDFKKSLSGDNSNEVNDLQNNYSCHSENDSFYSTDEQFKKLKTIENDDQIKNIVDDNDEDEMFCSQNLIQDCPFAFLSEESQIDYQSNSNHKNPTKVEKYENDYTSDKILETSNKISDKSINKDETLREKNQSTLSKNLLTCNDNLSNQISKINANQEYIKSKKYDSETDENIVHKKNKISSFNNKNKINHKEIESDSETDEEGIYSSYLSTNINKDSSFNRNQNDLHSSKKEPISFKKNNIILESSTTDSESSLFDDCDHENEVTTDNILVTENTNSTSAEEENVSKSSDAHKNIGSTMCNATSIHSTNVEKLSIDNNDDKNQLPVMQIIDKQKPTIANDSDNNSLASKSPKPKQSNLSIKVVEEFKDIESISTKKEAQLNELSSKIIDKSVINKNIEVSKNDSDEIEVNRLDREIQPKMSLNYSKRQLEEQDVKCIKKSKRINNQSSSNNLNANDSIERNMDEMFEGYQEKCIEKEPLLLTQQLTDILESTQLENNSSLDLNSSTLSPTLGTRKTSAKITKRRRTMLFDKSCIISQSKKSNDNPNDTIEKNLNEIFENTDNSVEMYESDGMLTQQLKSVLESQNDSQLFKEENSPEKQPLTLSMNSDRKRRLSLLVNLNSSLSPQKQIEKESSTKSDVKLNLDCDKRETTLQESNTNDDSQDTKIYLANLKSNKKKTFAITSQSEDESEDVKSLGDNDKEIAIKQKNERSSSENTKESIMPVECKSTDFINTKQSNDNNPLNKILSDTSKVRTKKRISLSLSKEVDLNSSQISLNDLEVEKRFFTKQDCKSTMPRVRLTNEPGNIDADLSTNSRSRRSSFDKVCTPNNTNLFIKEIVNTDDGISSDDDFLRSMPEIKVAGTADCPATNSQLAAPSDDDDDDDEETTSVSISPTDIVIPTKWNWYAKKRYDLIYKKSRSDAKIENNEVHDGSPPAKTQISGINRILEKIESANKRHVSKNTRRLIITKEDNNIARSTRSRRLHEENSIETLTNIINNSSDSNSDVDSNSALERIIPKYKTVEPRKLDWLGYAIDDSDEEFELLRKKCERMLAAPSVYTNMLTRDKNLNATKVKSKSKKTRRMKKGNRGSLKITCSYSDDDDDDDDDDDGDDDDDDDDFRSRGNMSKKARIADEDALVFQISAGDSKDYSKLRMSKQVAIAKKRSVATKADIDDNVIVHNQPAKLIESNGIVNIQQPLKLQEVSVLLSPLRENVLSRVNTECFTNIHDDIKSNFKQSVGVSTTIATRAKRPVKSKIKLDDSPTMTRSRKNIQNKTKTTRGQNETMLNIKRAKLDIQFEHSNNSSKENLYIDDSNVDSTSCESNVRITRRQKNKATNSSITTENGNNIENHNLRTSRGRITRQNRNKNEPTQKINNIKTKDIAKKSDSERCEENITKAAKNKRKQNIEHSDLENVVVSNRYMTRSTRAKDAVTVSCLNLVGKKKSSQIKNASVKENSHLDSDKIEIIHQTRTRSRSVKNNQDTDATKQLYVNCNDENETKSGRSCKLLSNSTFSDSRDNNTETNVSVNKSTNTSSRSLKRQKQQVVSPSEESQEVSDILQNIDDKYLGNNEIHNERLSNNKINPEKKFDSSCVSKKSESRHKRPRLNRLVKSNEFNDISNEDLLQRSSTSRKHNTLTLCELPVLSSLASLKNRISISKSNVKTPYKILFTGDKSKTYTETVIKLGGYITEDPAKCSILVTDKIRRTLKFLCSVARGVPIVSLKWLDDSDKTNHFLDWKDYILKDVVTENQLKFKLANSLRKAENNKLFKGYTLILTPRLTQPPISELKEMITCSGGKCLLRAPRNWSEKTVVITQTDDIQYAKKLATKAPISVTIHSKEFILTGILKQEINFDEFKFCV